MVGRSKPISAAQRRRFQIIKGEVGCIACMKDGRDFVLAEAHHLLSGGVRRGHDESIPVCKMHHRMAHQQKRAFREAYGTDDELLAETNRRVAEFEARIVR